MEQAGVHSAVIATALMLERGAVREHLSDLREVRHEQDSIYEVGIFTSEQETWEVAIVQTGQGNPRAAVEVERAVATFRPSHAFFIGVAGGLKDVALGDVVAATKVYGYESGKAGDYYKPRIDFGESSYDLTQEAIAVARAGNWVKRIVRPSDRVPNAFIAPIIAGEKLIASTHSSVYQFIKNNFSDALAVEMESIGFFRAMYANRGVSSLVVRGISDLIDKKAEADASGSQDMASRHAAAFVFEVLARIRTKSVNISGESTIGRSIEAITIETPAIPSRDVSLGREPDDRWWDELYKAAAEMYPFGPTENRVWERAGGDVSLINVHVPGRGSWYGAIKALRLGGGGSAISSRSLLETMLQDFGNNGLLRRLSEKIN